MANGDEEFHAADFPPAFRIYGGSSEDFRKAF
jgi:hypothetical protein